MTSTYLTNADFSQTTPLDNGLCGYGKDMEGKGTTYYGLQAIDGWTSVVVNGDNGNSSYPNSAMGGAVFAYGSDYLMMGNNTKAPATDPDGNTGNCLGFFGVWGCGGYYYQEVTLAAGKYTINIPVYNQSGTQANTSYIGWIPNSGTSYTFATNPAVGSWTTLSKTFTLADATTGKICLGYKSTGSGSGANNMLYFDKVQILYTAIVVKDVLSTAIAAATNANATLGTLTDAISTAQAVYDNEDATQDEVNNAAATLAAATELAMSAAGDVTGIFLENPGFESCTVTTTNAAAGGSAAPLAIDGEWTQTSSAAWSSSAVVAYGGSGQVNGASAPEADNAGNSGNALGVSVGWGGLVTYQSNAITLPAGVYTLKVNAYNNLSGVTQFASKFGFVPTDGTATISTKQAFTYATWETDQVTFTLNEATEGKIQIGGQAVSGGSGSNAKVFFDNITITYQSFLAGAKSAWDDAVAATETAKSEYPIVTGEELTALNAELAKAEPNTVDGYNEATEALNEAKATFVAAASSYNALATVNAFITSAGTLKYADANKKPSADVTATSAADADTKTASQYTALRAYYESHAFAEAVEGAKNYTSAIANPNAEDGNNGWTWTGSKNNPASNEPWTDANGNSTHKYFDGGNWGGTSWTTTMKQTISVPAGKYQLTARGRAATNTTLTMAVGDASVNFSHVGNSGNVFNRGWGDASLEFTVGEDDASVEILVTATAEPQYEWFSISEFLLIQLEETEVPMADASDYAALAAAITTAEANTLGFEAGQYAPYNNVAALTALAAAKAIDPEAEGGNRQKIVQNVTSALNDATWTANAVDVDAIYNGLYATVAEGANYPDGWTRTNAWGQMRSEIEGDYATAYYNQPGSLQYGNQGVYTMPLAANTYYKLTFAYRSHENDSNNGVTVSVLNGEDGLASKTFPGNGLTSVWIQAEVGFQTGAAGNYVLTLANSGNTWMTNVSLVKAEPTTASMVITDAQYATFVAPFDVIIPDGVTAYTIAGLDAESESENTLALNELKTGTIEANTPVVLFSENTVEEKFTGVPLYPVYEGVSFTNVTDGWLTGTYEEIDAPVGSYVIQKQASVGFYKVEGVQPKVKANRAYLTVPPSAKARAFFFDGADATAIDAVAAIAAGEIEAIYTAGGVQVKSLQKGLNIVVLKGGKTQKVFVK